MSTSKATVSRKTAQVRYLAWFLQHPGSTLPEMRKALHVDARSNRAVESLRAKHVLVERSGKFWANTGEAARATARPHAHELWESPLAAAKSTARPSSIRGQGRKGIPHRNTSAAQKAVLHFVDARPEATITDVAIACSHMSVRGEKGMLRSIQRLIDRDFLHASRAGLLTLRAPLTSLPPSVMPLTSRPSIEHSRLSELARAMVGGV